MQILKAWIQTFFYLKDADPIFDYYAPLLIANNDELKKSP